MIHSGSYYKVLPSVDQLRTASTGFVVKGELSFIALYVSEMWICQFN